MGKKGSSKKVPTAISGPQMSVTIREASTGKKHTNAKSSLKLQHIKNLAVWASCDAAIPSLGAFFGHHYAASSEALGTPVDPSLFTCQRCESILQPGYNCTIRIEKNKRCKGKNATRNNIVYACHFCSHRNMKRGTPRNMSPPKPKANSNSKPMTSRVHEPTSTTKPRPGNIVCSYETIIDNTVANTVTTPPVSTADGLIVEKSETSKFDITKDNLAANTAANPLGSLAEDPMGKVGISETSETLEVKNESAASGPSTPLVGRPLTLLESKMRKRNRSGAKKAGPSETPNAEKSVNTSNRRRRKSWTSLKEIAESNDNDKSRRLMNLTVPFSMQ